MASVIEKYKKMPKKNYVGRTVAFCVLGVHYRRCFPGEIVHLKITAEKSLFRQQFGNNITIVKEEIFFKGSEVFFPRFLKKTIFLRIF